MKSAILALASVAWISGSADALAGQVYCYATAQKSGDKLQRYLANQCTIYVTPVFHSDDSEYLLAAEFAEALPDAGLATCVTDEYDADLPAGRQSLIEGSKADHCTVSVQPPPVAPSPPQQSQ